MAANLDARVAATLDRANAHADHQDPDEDALIDELEKDDSLDAFREKRLQQLHSEFARAKHMRNSQHGSYTEVKDEKELMEITTSTKLCIVHFWKPDFNRCRIMDSHLETLAPLHLDTRFLRINVTNAPFVVTKLKVQVLPCVIAFVNGVGVDRIIGFEGLGRGNDRFTTRDLESRLLHAGALVRPTFTDANSLDASKRGLQGQTHAENDDYDEDEWD